MLFDDLRYAEPATLPTSIVRPTSGPHLNVERSDQSTEKGISLGTSNVEGSIKPRNSDWFRVNIVSVPLFEQFDQPVAGIASPL